MLHPTRSNLLLLKDKVASVHNSIGILRSRRQALILEFVKTSRPYLESRREMRKLYGEAIIRLRLGLGAHGRADLDSLAAAGRREFGITITPGILWGLHYKEVTADESARRAADLRGHDLRFTAPAVDEAADRFEQLLDAIIDLAVHDSKLKRLGREIARTTRRMRVLEERLLPGLNNRIREITQYLAERDRETHYRLKQFKQKRRPSRDQ